ncbi:enoyl-CoA hydratase/isomerase family protein [Rhodobacteraceae bacterium RKSG542]|uniref:enoyl-CoA hydratase/isomerase family protein n=1 Tax=Pseudovibrio flavus TaxID=2529854 RepID=UPI0012BCEB36|nr:enoyl-CoA hydratase/isomerase family protein [Pseudovibrio flavus]MTI15904.1 enoyl-CoA hydratase/isomerase family protein [Pseudovibrio flavus]
MSDFILFDVQEGVATATLNRPERLNAVNPLMNDEIVSIVERVNNDSEIRVLVLTGSGDRAFCAGSDIKELKDYGSPWAHRMAKDYCDAIRSVVKPTICAVNGYAMGGGLELALSCDIRVATQNAKFASPEIKLGWIGGGGMAAFLSRAVGPSKAARMLYTGDPIDAQTAKDWNLVDEIFADNSAMMAHVTELAKVIASRAPIAAQMAKINLHSAASMPLEQAIMYERDLRTIGFATQDAAEGKAAFAEKRPPKFTGR